LAVFLAQTHQTQERKKDWQALNQDCGGKCTELFLKPNQILSLLKTQKASFIEACEQSWEPCKWQDLKQKLKLSARRSAVRHMRGKECLSLPTVTTYSSSNGKGGPAGLTTLESTLRSQNRLSATQKLNPALCLWMMAIPPTWLDCIMTTGGE